MSVQTPPRLLNLAVKSLLRDEALAIAALECLPAELFPPLFMEAFSGGHRESLKAMVHAWPFGHLPLGGLMREPQLETLKAAFDGLDILLAEKVRPRRSKLQVLDLRNTGQDFWSMWSGPRDQVCSPVGLVTVPSCKMKQPSAPLKVFTDLCLSSRAPDRFLTYLLSWAKWREGPLHLCCKKLKIFAVPMKTVRKVLALVRLDCIQAVEVNCSWTLSTLGMFASYLGQMRNVRFLSLAHIHILAEEEEEQKQYVSQFTCQFFRLQHLRRFYMESPSFLKGRLDQLLRCLQTPLETLCITNCPLTESDLIHLSRCPNLRRLKDLDLSGVRLTGFSPEPLRALLEEVAATLQDLDLIYCGMVDSQAEAIMPVLSRCHQLRTLGISGNLLSVATVEKLLRHTAQLRSLSLELYPAPLESYSAEGALEMGRLGQIRDELTGILRDLGQPRTIWLSTSPCPHCGNKIFYDVEPILCPCDNLA
ncbi:PRAME family member 12-like [Saccopteryx leptura]|uniref:PRAME family member 12-like n=1 Tax=Saccopteryx leptura TaxID=249018 RepID=UPI00339C38F4